MVHIVAIGGGELKEKETFLIDQYICDIIDKKKPNALFIPTASLDAKRYWESFKQIYGTELNCSTKGLFLTKLKYSIQEINNLIQWADILYVGGGNTRMMLEVWDKSGLTSILTQVYHDNTQTKVFSGLSAGAICWFKYGNSDSPLFENKMSQKMTIKLKGINLIEAAFCPHFDVEEHRPIEFENMMKNTPDVVGFGVENNCAIHIFGNEYRVIKSDSNAMYYKFTNINGEISIDKKSSSLGLVRWINS